MRWERGSKGYGEQLEHCIETPRQGGAGRRGDGEKLDQASQSTSSSQTVLNAVFEQRQQEIHANRTVRIMVCRCFLSLPFVSPAHEQRENSSDKTKSDKNHTRALSLPFANLRSQPGP